VTHPSLAGHLPYPIHDVVGGHPRGFINVEDAGNLLAPHTCSLSNFEL